MFQPVCSTTPMTSADPELKQARTALLTKKKQLQDELRRVEQAISALAGVIEGGGAPRQRSGSVRETVTAILRDNGGIMHADEVLAEARKRGLELSSRDPKATIVTALIRLRDDGQVEAHGLNRYSWRKSPLEQLVDTIEPVARALGANPTAQGKARWVAIPGAKEGVQGE